LVEIELTIAFVLAALVVAVFWVFTGNPALAIILATTVAVVVVAIGDARRRTIQRNMSRTR
jgi:hypothetical protein